MRFGWAIWIVKWPLAHFIARYRLRPPFGRLSLGYKCILVRRTLVLVLDTQPIKNPRWTGDFLLAGQLYPIFEPRTAPKSYFLKNNSGRCRRSENLLPNADVAYYSIIIWKMLHFPKLQHFRQRLVHENKGRLFVLRTKRAH